MVAIFAGNHGVTDQGVSAFPREVTAQMVANFTAGGAAISQICALHELNLRVFELALELPTGDITQEPAMDDRMCAATIAYGMEAVAGKPDLLCIGEMGIGNTTVAAAHLRRALRRHRRRLGRPRHRRRRRRAARARPMPSIARSRSTRTRSAIRSPSSPASAAARSQRCSAPSSRRGSRRSR